MMHIILDNGHGTDHHTKGKYSPALDPDEFDLTSSLVWGNGRL